MPSDNSLPQECAETLNQLSRAGIDFITGVPDTEFRFITDALEIAPGRLDYAIATREDNALALAVGSHLAGRSPLVFMESAGIGTSLDTLTSLAMAYAIPIIVLVAWAGYGGRDTPHHNPLGKPLDTILTQLGIAVNIVPMAQMKAELGRTVSCAKQTAHSRRQPVVVLGIPDSLVAEQ